MSPPSYKAFSPPTSCRSTRTERSTSPSCAATPTGSSSAACTGCIPTARPASSPASRPRNAAGSSPSWRTRTAAACPSWPEPPKPTPARRSKPASTTIRSACGPWPSFRRSTTSSARRRSTPTSRRSATTRRVDVTLYNIPMFASPIDVPTVQRLSEECERIVAIKDSSGDLPHMIRMIQAVRPNRPEFAFLTGWDAALMPMLLIGCDGGTNATSGVVPEITRKLYDLTLERRIDEARELQYKLVTLFDMMILSADFPEGFRQALKLRGIETGVGRQPYSSEQRLAARDAQQRAGVPAGRRRLCRRTGGRLPGRCAKDRPGASGPHRAGCAGGAETTRPVIAASQLRFLVRGYLAVETPRRSRAPPIASRSHGVCSGRESAIPLRSDRPQHVANRLARDVHLCPHDHGSRVHDRHG